MQKQTSMETIGQLFPEETQWEKFFYTHTYIIPTLAMGAVIFVLMAMYFTTVGKNLEWDEQVEAFNHSFRMHEIRMGRTDSTKQR